MASQHRPIFPPPMFASNSASASLQLPSPIFKDQQPPRGEPSASTGPGTLPMRVEDLMAASAPSTPPQPRSSAPARLPDTHAAPNSSYTAYTPHAASAAPPHAISAGRDAPPPCGDCAQAATRAARWAVAGLSPPLLPPGPAPHSRCSRCGGAQGAGGMGSAILAHLDNLRTRSRMQASQPGASAARAWEGAGADLAAGGGMWRPHHSNAPRADLTGGGGGEGADVGGRKGGEAGGAAGRPGPVTPSRILGSTQCLSFEERAPQMII